MVVPEGIFVPDTDIPTCKSVVEPIEIVLVLMVVVPLRIILLPPPPKLNVTPLQFDEQEAFRATPVKASTSVIDEPLTIVPILTPDPSPEPAGPETGIPGYKSPVEDKAVIVLLSFVIFPVLEITLAFAAPILPTVRVPVIVALPAMVNVVPGFAP